jgi:cob(I)alamin adenosyltransferase
VLRNLFSEYLLDYCQDDSYPAFWFKRVILRQTATSLLDPDDREILEYYKLSLHNLSALVYYRFNDTRYITSSSQMMMLQARHQHITTLIKPAQDFIIPESKRSIALDHIRVQVRTVEHFMWVVIDNIYGEFLDDYNECIKQTAAEFNLLSNYLYNLNRYEGLKENQPELYWTSQ